MTDPQRTDDPFHAEELPPATGDAVIRPIEETDEVAAAVDDERPVAGLVPEIRRDDPDTPVFRAPPDMPA